MFNPTLSSEVTKENLTTDNFSTIQQAMADLMGEIEAIIDYNNHVNTATNEVAKRTWTHIRDEEMHHVGELLGLLEYLTPTFKTHVAMGRQEFNSTLNNGMPNNMPNPMFGNQNNMQ